MEAWAQACQGRERPADRREVGSEEGKKGCDLARQYKEGSQAICGASAGCWGRATPGREEGGVNQEPDPPQTQSGVSGDDKKKTARDSIQDSPGQSQKC